jgi:hypothetical protein
LLIGVGVGYDCAIGAHEMENLFVVQHYYWANDPIIVFGPDTAKACSEYIRQHLDRCLGQTPYVKPADVDADMTVWDHVKRSANP